MPSAQISGKSIPPGEDSPAFPALSADLLPRLLPKATPAPCVHNKNPTGLPPSAAGFPPNYLPSGNIPALQPTPLLPPTNFLTQGIFECIRKNPLHALSGVFSGRSRTHHNAPSFPPHPPHKHRSIPEKPHTAQAGPLPQAHTADVPHRYPCRRTAEMPPHRPLPVPSPFSAGRVYEAQ